MNQIEDYAPTILRIGLGFLFLLPGLISLWVGEGHMIAEMLGPVGAWILLGVEIIFGLTVLLGWQVEYSVIPLIVIMGGAIYMTILPELGDDGMVIDLLFHLLAIAGLISLSLSGAGAYAIDD